MKVNSYLNLRNKYDGGSCMILGAGPSLYFNMHEPFFKEISQHGLTIAVNSAVMVVPNFDYWISNDVMCRTWSWYKNVIKGKGAKIVRSSWKKYKKELKDFLFFDPRPTSENVINSEHLGLSYCNSTCSALDLSIQMGFKKVFIFGLDHNTIKNKHHFWEFLPKEKQPTYKHYIPDSWEKQQENFSIAMKAYKALKGFADIKNVDIYNVNWKYFGRYLTKVNTFKKIEICDIKKII